SAALPHGLPSARQPPPQTPPWHPSPAQHDPSFRQGFRFDAHPQRPSTQDDEQQSASAAHAAEAALQPAGAGAPSDAASSPHAFVVRLATSMTKTTRQMELARARPS